MKSFQQLFKAERASFMDAWPVQLHRVSCSDGPRLGGMICHHHFDILHDFINEHVLLKSNGTLKHAQEPRSFMQ